MAARLGLTKGGHFTGMLCAPGRTILSTQLSRDLIIPAYASGDRSEGDGDYRRELRSFFELEHSLYSLG